ncbi:Glycosyltransferase, GT2 family [Nocardioides scoriae]|uniref:Glycosyltransferase, GT2 family n=1 Tax=Nocardioides scoriae TaxID=642780 RepID=A0A1H1WYH7_9ACTN|nr:glycosyltransferase [Nocardioides scoriae]SDT01801.1 Glycosyltransferase, GT2 family [Nocardioides scoriae]
MTAGEQGTVVVATCTYARPEQLRRTLAAVGEQTAAADVRTLLLVVDNDPSCSARPVAESVGAAYVVEPRRGVGNARNRALGFARELGGPVVALVFFDDDQAPAPGWYQAFLRAHARWPEAILSGPVQPDLGFDVPDWAAGGWPWRRPDHPDGARVPMSGDGNVLLPAAVLARPECRYAATFAQGMGQDTELFTRLRRAGADIRHVAGAAAQEDVTPDRRELGWVLDRARRAADAWASVTREEHPWGRARVALAVGARAWGSVRRARRGDAEARARQQVVRAELRTLVGRLR